MLDNIIKKHTVKLILSFITNPFTSPTYKQYLLLLQHNADTVQPINSSNSLTTCNEQNYWLTKKYQNLGMEGKASKTISKY